MRVVDVGAGGATIAVDYDELVLLYGGLVESMEALSPHEFQVRLGRSEQAADALRAELKPVVVEVGHLHGDC